MDDPKAKLVEGDPRTPTNFRRPELEAHLAELRQEFAGAPELCFRHAELIVRIRRGIALEADLPAFFALWAQDREFLAARLSTRWLISALDTFADQGAPAQRALALIPVTLIAMLKLGETERLVLADPSFSPEKFEALRRFRQHGFVYLWDGMTAYAMHNGDVLKNLLRRFDALSEDEPALRLIGRVLVERALAGDTLLSRLALHNPWLTG